MFVNVMRVDNTIRDTPNICLEKVLLIKLSQIVGSYKTVDVKNIFNILMSYILSLYLSENIIFFYREECPVIVTFRYRKELKI